MKLILAVLAISCTAFAMPEERIFQAGGSPPDPCVEQCVNQERYRAAGSKAFVFLDQVASGTQPTTFPVNPEKWGEYCTELGNIRTCVEACNAPDVNAAYKAKALVIINGASDIICDAEIKAKLPCLVEVAKVASPTCNDQCRQFKQPFADTFNQFKQHGVESAPTTWEQAKVAGKNVCLFVNCRLKCRKNDIEAKCQADGFNAAKKLAKKVAVLGQNVHAQFRPAANYPEECKPDKVVEGT